MVWFYLLGDLEFGVTGIHTVVGNFRTGRCCKLNRLTISCTCTLLSSDHDERLRVNDGQGFLLGGGFSSLLISPTKLLISVAQNQFARSMSTINNSRSLSRIRLHCYKMTYINNSRTSSIYRGV